MRRQVLLVVGPLAFPMLALLSGCAQPPPPAADAPASSAVHVEASAPAPTTPPPAPTPTPVASAEPPPAAPTASASAAPATPPEAPLPKVKVSNIGMHIGGGPNDDATKEPIKKSVEPHFDAFRRCWGLIGDAQAKGDVGVDLHIGKDGGKAKVDHPRTALKGKPFSECVVSTFEAIDFRKPKTGNTTVSYSLRFTPAKRRPLHLHADDLRPVAHHRERDLGAHRPAQRLGHVGGREIAHVLAVDADDLVAVAQPRLRPAEPRRDLVDGDAPVLPILAEHRADRADGRRAAEQRERDDYPEIGCYLRATHVAQNRSGPPPVPPDRTRQSPRQLEALHLAWRDPRSKRQGHRQHPDSTDRHPALSLR
jgi:hypothetical protein